MIICIHTVCRERWKPSISSQFYSAFRIKPPLFTFSISTQSSARQLLYSPLVRIWETLLWTKVWKQVFCPTPSPPPSIKQCGRPLKCLLAPEVVAMDMRRNNLKCHPFSLNPRWKSETPARRGNTSDALICSLMLSWFCTCPRHHAHLCCEHPTVFVAKTNHWLNFCCYLHDSAGSSKLIQNSCLPV